MEEYSDLDEPDLIAIPLLDRPHPARLRPSGPESTEAIGRHVAATSLAPKDGFRAPPLIAPFRNLRYSDDS